MRTPGTVYQSISCRYVRDPPRRCPPTTDTVPDSRETFNYVNIQHGVNDMFEPFSSGYYLGRLYVEPYGGDHAVINRGHHERVKDRLYESGDEPLVMKIGSTHVASVGPRAFPGGRSRSRKPPLSATGTDNPPTLREVFLAKADRARQLLEYGADAPEGF